jgi:hypothetical protein
MRPRISVVAALWNSPLEPWLDGRLCAPVSRELDCCCQPRESLRGCVLRVALYLLIPRNWIIAILSGLGEPWWDSHAKLSLARARAEELGGWTLDNLKMIVQRCR